MDKGKIILERILERRQRLIFTYRKKMEHDGLQDRLLTAYGIV
jgi:hypothetical protein